VQDLFLTLYPHDPSFGLGSRLNRNKSLPWFGLYAFDEAYGHTEWTTTCFVIDPKYSMTIFFVYLFFSHEFHLMLLLLLMIVRFLQKICFFVLIRHSETVRER